MFERTVQAGSLLLVRRDCPAARIALTKVTYNIAEAQAKREEQSLCIQIRHQPKKKPTKREGERMRCLGVPVHLVSSLHLNVGTSQSRRRIKSRSEAKGEWDSASGLQN